MKKFNIDSTAPIPIVTDTHFGSKNFHKAIFNQALHFFEEQFFPWCLKNGVKDVIHTGDLVHNRNLMDLWMNQEIKQRFFQWFDDNGVNLHIIVGNHDIYYKSTIEYNYLAENANEFKNVYIYQEQKKVQIGKYQILMVPWVISNKGFKFKSSADICCGHFDMIGIKMTAQMYSQEGFKVEDFEKFKKVFSGHYHIRSQKKNVHYTGCPYPITWNDYGEDKGYYVLEDNYNIKWVDNKVNARFLKIYYQEFEGEQTVKIGGIKKKSLVDATLEDAISLASKNFCRVVTNTLTNQFMFDQFYSSLVAVSRDGYKIEIVDANEIIENFDLTELEQEIQEEADILTTVSTYLTGMTFEKDVEKDFLIQLFEELHKEASEKVIEQ